jgi:serine/threonine protein kinase
MTPEELTRVRKIYERALTLSGGERSSFVEGECAEHSGMRAEVERLLNARERIPAWLDQPALGVPSTLSGLQPPRMEGRHLGGYTLLREIGRGGMGRVYLANRSDGAYAKQVAIKLVLPSVDSSAMLSRFQHEREILASLDHPNIARLLDGGSTEEGWPYFVMEFVDGQPIHRWCDERRLNISQRLELFRNVLAAVRYAHQRLVVHRDLKPGNILVTGDGVVKLLDFGIAKVMRADAGTEPDTATLAAIMTPDYASPEQLSGAPVTTLSDVYSLGVVLYELLTGHRPYRVLSAALHELARVIAEVEPPRPSEIVAITEPDAGRNRAPITPASVSEVREGDPRRLRKRLAGDLDSILLNSLRKEPERRYSSAEAFASDLDRHLNHLPIAASEAGIWYRVRRFFRRNPGAVVAVALGTVPLMTGLIALVAALRQELLSAPTAGVNGAPFLLFMSGVCVTGLGLALYLFHPGQRESLAALCGGVFCTGAAFTKMWVAHSMGWVSSRLTGIPEPLLLFGEPIWRSPLVWISAGIGATAGMLLLSWVKARFGWTWLATFIGLISIYTVLKERVFFTTILPASRYLPGFVPIFVESAFYFGGGLLGFLIMGVIERTFAAGPAGLRKI